jgi:Kef-type K+ transport system membrane component KefB
MNLYNMKVIKFIKKNISVFNFISIMIFFYLVKFIFINKSNEEDNHLIFFLIAFVILIILIFFLLFDFILKKIITQRLKLNFVELLITTTLFSILYLIFYTS